MGIVATMAADAARGWARRAMFACLLTLGVVLMHSVAASLPAHAHGVEHAQDVHDGQCPDSGTHQHSEMCIGNTVDTTPFAPPAQCDLESLLPEPASPQAASVVVDHAGRDPPILGHSRSQLQIWRV